MLEPIVVISAIILMIIFCVTEKMSALISMLFVALILLVFNIISFEEAFGDLASNTAVTFIGISIISSALIETGLLTKVCDLLLKYAKTKNRLIICLIMISFLMAIVISNKITIMFSVSIMYELSKNKKLKISPKFTAFILLASCLGGLTIIPTTGVLLTSSNLLIKQGLPGLKVLQYAPFAIIYLIMLFVYYFLYGEKTINKITTKEDKNIYNNSSMETYTYNKTKQIITLLILGISIILFIFTNIKTGLITMVGAVLCIIFGFVDEKKAIKNVNWSIVLMLACSGAISSGLINSGVSAFIANNVFSFITPTTSKIITIMVVAGVVVLTTNFITMVSSISIYIPIGIMLATRIGLNPTYMAMLITLCAYSSHITPINTRNALVLDSGNVKLKDLIILNGPFMILTYIVNVIIFSILM